MMSSVKNNSRHNFEIAKERLKEFSETESEKIQIRKVNEDFFIIFDHKVTGEEFNDRMNVVQKHLVDLNENINKIIKEFGQVYNALEALDKEYIAAILKAFESLEITHNKLEDRTSQLAKNQKKIVKSFQEEIKEISEEFFTKCDEVFDKVDRISEEREKDKKELREIIKQFLGRVEENVKKIETLELQREKDEKALKKVSKIVKVTFSIVIFQIIILIIAMVV